MKARLALGATAAALVLAACSHNVGTTEAQTGGQPVLPDPIQYLFPPMKIATPVGWKAGEAPTAPPGFVVTAFASGLKGPRNILPLANGDVLAVESGGPGTENVLRPKNIIYGMVIGKAHSPVKPGNRVVLLRDSNGDGKADQQAVLIDKLNSPFGITMVGNTLYVAETDRVMRYPFTVGQTRIAGPASLVTELPGGPVNHHWTKSLTASPDGSKLYVGIGSNSNIVERGIGAEYQRAQIWEVDPVTGASRPFATGLRNPNGLTFQPATGQLWTVVNERDEIGNNLVPDYMTSVREGAFYGWPWSYYGQHVDIRVKPERPDMVAKAIPADYALGAHVAALGLAFNSFPAFPAHYANGAFIGEHGSWDRNVPSGYQVAFVPFAGGKPAGKVETFLTGFLGKDGHTRGRPVSVAFDRGGALLVADDVGNVIWRVTPSAAARTVSAVR
ncbi:PQQ-dependent sugar dehydrogenase [Novosphingobium tardum]|uniref:PQQ-dependent sugar dehydrogenase n=1 Tax=Novosphingobium tardum TaxID=1538021 RepID=A0ABV8RV09_9SPHN